MATIAGTNEANAELVQPRNEMVAEIEAMTLNVVDADLLDQVQCGVERVNCRKVEISQLEASGSRRERHVVRARDEVCRRLGQADRGQISRLKFGQRTIPVEKTKALRDQQALVSTRTEKGRSNSRQRR